MNLTKLIELQAAATPGPWNADGERNNRIIWSSPDDRVCFMTSDGKAVENDAFITAARNFDFAALDEKIKRYEDALNDAKRFIEHMPKGIGRGAASPLYMKICQALECTE